MTNILYDFNGQVYPFVRHSQKFQKDKKDYYDRWMANKQQIGIDVKNWVVATGSWLEVKIPIYGIFLFRNETLYTSDIDNQLKTVIDALAKMSCTPDDRYYLRVIAEKMLDKENPGCEIFVTDSLSEFSQRAIDYYNQTRLGESP